MMISRLLRLLPLCFALLLAACTEGEPECPESDTFCGSLCTDLAIDATNCGACGTVCSAGFQCLEGACACVAGQTACGTSCTTIENDARNCGGCGNVCDSGEICVDGSCGCADGGESCEGLCQGLVCQIDGADACVDQLTDEQNCGACGAICPGGSSCLGGVCSVGDLYATCFTEGTVVPLLKATDTVINPKASGIDGPQALALFGTHLLAVGSIDETLYVIDRATMLSVGTVSVGSSPNQILVRGTKAYVISSLQNTVDVVNLANPSTPTIGDQIALAAGSSPQAAAFDDAGTLWVSSWSQDTLTPIDFSGTLGVAGTPVALETTGVEGKAYPAGVAAIGTRLFVALNNLGDDFGPAGNGRLSIFDSADSSKSLVDLGSSCTNPGFMAVEGTNLYVACTNSYFEGEVAIFDTVAGEVIRRIPTTGGPARIALDPARPGHFYAADASSLGFFSVDAGGEFSRVDVCPVPAEGGWEFNSDVIVAP